MQHQSSAVLFLLALVALSIPVGAALSDPPKHASDPSKQRYVFVQDTDRWVEVHLNERVLFGKLDKNGDFIHEYMFEKSAAWNLGFVPTIINFPGLTPKKAYEFRSAILIPGELQPDGRFVPQAGGKIIPFKDYEYTPIAPPHLEPARNVRQSERSSQVEEAMTAEAEATKSGDDQPVTEEWSHDATIWSGAIPFRFCADSRIGSNRRVRSIEKKVRVLRNH